MRCTTRFHFLIFDKKPNVTTLALEEEPEGLQLEILYAQLLEVQSSQEMLSFDKERCCSFIPSRSEKDNHKTLFTLHFENVELSIPLTLS